MKAPVSRSFVDFGHAPRQRADELLRELFVRMADEFGATAVASCPPRCPDPAAHRPKPDPAGRNRGNHLERARRSLERR